MLFVFALDHNAAKETKNICFSKGHGGVDHSTVTFNPMAENLAE